MIDSIIEFILSNNSCMHEIIKHGREYEKLSAEGLAAYDKLMAILNDEQKNYLNIFAEAQLGQECEAADTYFREGMKFGVRFLVECLGR